MVSKFKVFLSVVLFFFFASTVFAGDYAVDKGSVIVSGTFAFTNASGDLYKDDQGNSETSIALNPSALYFVRPNLAVGGNFLLTHASQGDASMSALAIGPKVAYFIGGPNSKVYPYFGAGFAYVRQSYDENGDNFTISGTKISLGAGAAVMVKPHWALVFEGAYNLDNMKPEDGESASGNIFGVSVGIAGFIF